jgi:hypothetical protein
MIRRNAYKTVAKSATATLEDPSVAEKKRKENMMMWTGSTWPTIWTWRGLF